MKSAFVTGAGGWIGLELVKNLLENGYRVKALVRRNSKVLNSLKKIYEDRLSIIKGDMISIENWQEEIKDVACLYHLAAKVHTKPKNENDINEFYLINRDSTKKLFDKCLEYRISKLLFVSTVAVYGKHGNDIIQVKTKRNPETPYGISKNESEIYGLKLYEDYNLPISIVQPVTVYGGNDRGNFKKLYRLADKGICIIFGNGENKKSIVYYKDLVSMIKNIAESKNTIGKTFICGSESISYNDIIEKLKSDSKLKIVFKVNNSLYKIIIKLLRMFKMHKLDNIASNIETLSNDNIYDFSNSIEYISENNITLFKEWKCKEEYGG